MRREWRCRLSRPRRGLAWVFLLFGLLQVVFGFWWWLPFRPDYEWQTPFPLADAALSESGRTLVAIHDGEAATVWDVASGRQRAALPDYAGPSGQGCLWCSPDDRFVAYLSDSDPIQGCLRLWDLEANREHFAIPKGNTAVEELLADGDTLRLTDHRLVSLRTGRERALPDELAELLANGWQFLGWNPRRALLLQYEKIPEYSVAVWDWTTQSFALPPQEITGSGGELHPFLRLSPDGDRLALLRGAATEVWSLSQPGKVIATFAEAGKWQAPYYFSPDGKLLIVLTAHRAYGIETLNVKVEVWDLTAEPPRLLVSNLNLIDFSADGRWALAPNSGLRCELGSLRTEQSDFLFASDALPHFTADARFLVGQATVDAYRLDWLPSWLFGQRTSRSRLQVVDMTNRHRPPASIPLASEKMHSKYKLVTLSTGSRVLTFQKRGLIQAWDLPLRRSVLVEYGLPLLCVLLALITGWRVRRLFREEDAPSSAEQVQPGIPLAKAVAATQ